METIRLGFGRKPESPGIQTPGLLLKILAQEFSLSRKEPLWTYGCCRIGKNEWPGDRKEIPGAIFITAVEMFRQQPLSANLLRETIVFEDDVLDAGNDYLLYFHFNLLETVKIPLAPVSFIVHASFGQYLSNFIGVEIKY